MTRLWWSKAQQTWLCGSHGVVTLSAAGRPSCGCSLVVQFDKAYTIRPVDTSNLPNQNRDGAK